MQAFIGSTYSRSEALEMARNASTPEWVLYEPPDQAFGIPPEVGNIIYATLLDGQGARGLPRLLEAIPEGADLSSVPPRLAAWLLVSEIPRCAEEDPDIHRLVRTLTRLYERGRQTLITDFSPFERIFQTLAQKPSVAVYGLAAMVCILRGKPCGAVWAVPRAHKLMTGSDTVIREVITAKVVELLRDCQPVH